MKIKNWHADVFFGIHYDLHARADDMELGAELTEEHLLEHWKAIQPDWIQCDCKGHPGYTSWPTETGSTSPGIAKDSLAIHSSATRKLGIKLGMHYSGIRDVRAIELHPEWANVHSDGGKDNESVCLLSGYVENLMIPQLLEVIRKYDVDGFWVDGDNWGARPCWCEYCKAEFSKRTGTCDIPADKESAHWLNWLSFHRDLFVEYVKKYSDAIHEAKPTCLACSNWMYTIRQPDPIQYPIDYISGDFTPWWGGDRAATEGRLIDSRNISWDLMAWGFGSTAGEGNEKSIQIPKNSLHLCQEISEVIGLGGAVMVYVQPQRSGWLNGQQHKVLAEVAEFARKRQDCCFQSQSASEAMVLHVKDHYYAHNTPLFVMGQAVQPVEGALHTLLENQISTDIIRRENVLNDMSNCKLLCIPEQTRLDDELIERLMDFTATGGIVLASGAHLGGDYGELFGVEPDGDAVTVPWAVPVEDKAFQMHGEWQPVLLKENTTALAYALSDFDPEKNQTDKVIVTRKNAGRGAFVGIHGAIFKDYFEHHNPIVRQFIRNLIVSLNIEWQVSVDAPPWVEVILRRKADKLIINLLNRGSCETLSARRFVVEALPHVDDICLNITLPNAPKSVSLVPSEGELEHCYEDGQLRLSLRDFHIHSAICVNNDN